MRRFDDFCRALKNLQEIRGKQPPYDTIPQTGMVSLLEICFEQAWKAMKEALELNGFSKEQTGSQRSSLATPSHIRIMMLRRLTSFTRHRNVICQCWKR